MVSNPVRIKFGINEEKYLYTTWVHGNSAVLSFDPSNQFSNAAIEAFLEPANFTVRGSGTRLESIGQAREIGNYVVHFPIPTHTRDDIGRLSLHSIILDYRMIDNARATSVEVWNGANLVDTIMDSSINTPSNWTVHEVSEHPFLLGGINIAIKLDISATAEGIAEFYGVAINVIRKSTNNLTLSG